MLAKVIDLDYQEEIGLLHHSGSKEEYCCCSVAKSCPTPSNLMDCSLPGSSVHGISQARILEWVAISSSRGFSQIGVELTSPALAGGFLPLSHLGSPIGASVVLK